MEKEKKKRKWGYANRMAKQRRKLEEEGQKSYLKITNMLSVSRNVQAVIPETVHSGNDEDSLNMPGRSDINDPSEDKNMSPSVDPTDTPVSFDVPSASCSSAGNDQNVDERTHIVVDNEQSQTDISKKYVENFFCRPDQNDKYSLAKFFEYHPYQPQDNLPFNSTKAYMIKDGKRRMWVTFRPKNPALFCNLCLVYGEDSGPFITGNSDWKHIYVRIDEHEKTRYPKNLYHIYKHTVYFINTSLVMG